MMRSTLVGAGALVAVGMATAAHAAEPATTPAAPTAPAAPTKVLFQEIDAAAEQAVATDRVLAMYFTADWCGWCRKMESSTFADAAVIAPAARFSWATVDIDARPDVAAIFGVQGVPAMVFLNTRGELLAQKSGYLPTPPMTELLTELAGKANAPGAAREGAETLLKARSALAEAKTDEELAAAVATTLELLAKPGPESKRDRLKQSLIAAAPRVWPALVRMLGDERLAMRAAAYEAVRASAPTEGAPAYDAFAEPDRRSEQAAAWAEWLKGQTRPAT